MSWSTEMLVRDRITRLHAEVAHDRLALTVAGPSRAGARLGAGGWWRRLMGLPAPAAAPRPAAGRIA
jgi:hypothetical protein